MLGEDALHGGKPDAFPAYAMSKPTPLPNIKHSRAPLSETGCCCVDASIAIHGSGQAPRRTANPQIAGLGACAEFDQLWSSLAGYFFKIEKNVQPVERLSLKIRAAGPDSAGRRFPSGQGRIKSAGRFRERSKPVPHGSEHA